VQSLDRAFELLERLADAGGELGLSQLAAATRLPPPTIHRIMRTLMAGGYVRQEPSRRYALGPGLIRLGTVAGHTIGSWAMPYLGELAAEIGETANLAMLEGDSAVYLAQVPSRHSMRMFTEVGRRVMPHCTGVGKALLAELPVTEVRGIVARTGLPAQTDRTIGDVEVLLAELAGIRERGYAVDDGEQETGVRCVAVSVQGIPARIAMSVSGPSARVTMDRVAEIAPIIQRAADRLSADICGNGASGSVG
jgi:IclR family acetate operon transcriptional repressor